MGLLHRVQRAVRRGKAFTVLTIGTIGLHGEHERSWHGLAIDDHRAGAADTVFAATWTPV